MLLESDSFSAIPKDIGVTSSPPTEWNLRDLPAAMLAIDMERITSGKTVLDVEVKSGVSFNSAWHWAGGTRSPQLANLVALAETLGFEIVVINEKTAETWSLLNPASALAAIGRARTASGWGVKELRARTSVATNSFYSWLKQTRDPTLQRFVALVEPLGFRVVMRRK